MSEKIFDIRAQLKGDTLENWNAANPVLLANELAIVTVPAESGAVAQEPAILFKVGNGTDAFKALPYVSAKAADVYDWAKAAAKPTYSASEISGLADYISGEIQDTNTQYKLEQDATDGHILKLYSKAVGATDWTVEATITTVDTEYDDTALAGRVTALETLVGSTAVATQIANAIAALNLAETYATKNELKAVSDLVGALPEGATATTVVGYVDEKAAAAEYDDTEVKASIQANTTAIATLNGTGEGSVDKKVADAVAAIVADAPEAYDTLKEISDWISSHAEDASAMNSQINTNKTDIAALKALVGTLPETAEAHTVVDYISEVVGVELGKLGDLASKDKVAKTDLEDALKTEIDGKANDADLAAVAKSGKIADLVQDAGSYIVLNCGSATTVI